MRFITIPPPKAEHNQVTGQPTGGTLEFALVPVVAMLNKIIGERMQWIAISQGILAAFGQTQCAPGSVVALSDEQHAFLMQHIMVRHPDTPWDVATARQILDWIQLVQVAPTEDPRKKEAPPAETPKGEPKGEEKAVTADVPASG